MTSSLPAPSSGPRPSGRPRGSTWPSSDGTMQMMPLTAMMEGAKYGDTLNFYGTFKTGKSAMSRLSVTGGHRQVEERLRVCRGAVAHPTGGGGGGDRGRRRGDAVEDHSLSHVLAVDARRLWGHNVNDIEQIESSKVFFHTYCKAHYTIDKRKVRLTLVL
ncbi:hypothetical protein SAY86_017341 [Trapa natans]|uniref:Uncharacterized protein n=1 Tax=Trapa natans TaxID=22666 RepID=A0AAN7R508_TRANT|nr:hypothetical protein SAY86_017341 [Trapa natans]